MAWRSWWSAAVLVLAAGCAANGDSRSPVLPGDYAPVSHPPPPTPTGESDDDQSLENWKSSVLDRADGDTIELIRRDIAARIRRLEEEDSKLSYQPPGLVLEDRTRIARRIAFEKKRLEMVDDR